MAQVASELITVPLPGTSRVSALPRWRVMVWLAALTALAVMLAATWLWYTGSIATSSYDIQRLRAERAAWQTKNEQLRVELARVRSLTWVEHEAVSRLQMQKAPPPVYLTLDGGQVVSPDVPVAAQR